MKKKCNFYGAFAIFALVLATTSITSCGQDEEYYANNVEMATMADRLMTRAGEGGEERVISSQYLTCTVTVYLEVPDTTSTNNETEDDYTDDIENPEDTDINDGAFDFLHPNYGEDCPHEGPNASITFKFTLYTYNTGRKYCQPDINLTNNGFHITNMIYLSDGKYKVFAQGPDGRNYVGITQ